MTEIDCLVYAIKAIGVVAMLAVALLAITHWVSVKTDPLIKYQRAKKAAAEGR